MQYNIEKFIDSWKVHFLITLISLLWHSQQSGNIYVFLHTRKLNTYNIIKTKIDCGLYCIDAVVIAAQGIANFLRSIVLPRMQVLLGREYAD